MGASNTDLSGISVPRTARTRLTSRIAESECPPRVKKSSSGPTPSTPSTSANTWQRISSRTPAGSRPAPVA
ncbi:hypothetical protein LUX57_49245 [Actinomadura madurae]|nr:hypothetical protein [Actinomadura madurae]MCP9972090.1 hypothetical protein [Actinomadura madurae]MCQ0003859.1 hypothetical protein [Actinomadura madurae]